MFMVAPPGQANLRHAIREVCKATMSVYVSEAGGSERRRSPGFDAAYERRVWRRAPRRLGSPVEEHSGSRGYDKAWDRAYAIRRDRGSRTGPLHHEPLPRKHKGLVWKRKAEESESSNMKLDEGSTILVGIVPCRLPARDVWLRMHTSGSHEGRGVSHATGNLHQERSKRPRLVSATGREIVGPGFSDGLATCMGRSGDGGQMKLKQSGTTSKTKPPGIVSVPRWCPSGLTCTQR
jgi:hypothetical protein